MRVGFIGLGLMGSAMAEHVLRAGYPLTVYNRTASKADRLKELGAQVAPSPASLGEQVDLLLICAGDGASVKELLFGADGAANTLRKDTLVADHTTISPADAEEIGRMLAERGIEFLDAPVTGGDRGARLGKLTTMVGGTVSNFERAKPIFESFSGRILRIGEIGSGQKLKCVNQICAVLNSIAVSEAFDFAARLGLNLEQCYEVLSSGAANSWVLENFGPKIIRDDFSPGFSARHSRKDLGIVLEEAKRLGFELLLSPHAKEALDQAFEKGFAELGNHSVFRVFQEKSS